MCGGHQQNERDRLNIKSFYVSLAFSTTHKDSQHSAHSLTLHYLPRIINWRALEISGSNVQPGSPAFATLHRLVSPEKVARGVVLTYGSREKVRASEGLRFEIYMGDVKVLNGIFRKDEGQNWKMECTCALQGDDVEVVKEAEVCVALEGDVAVICEKVAMAVLRGRGRNARRCKLEGIPGEREAENDECESDGCCCFECKSKVEMDGGDIEMDGLRWAVDVGIWVVSLGVGFLLTRASSKILKRV